MPLTRKDLDNRPCSGPGCDHSSHTGPMFLHQQCHRGAGTRCSYLDGVLTVRCVRCERMVAEIAVAE